MAFHYGYRKNPQLQVIALHDVQAKTQEMEAELLRANEPKTVDSEILQNEK